MEQTWNVYAYCGGDPVNYIDPYGEQFEWLLGLAIGAIGGGYIGGAIQNQSLNPFEWKHWEGVGIGAVMGGFAGAMIGSEFAPQMFATNQQLADIGAELYGPSGAVATTTAKKGKKEDLPGE